METFDPATGEQLPADAIQRVLFIASSVHVYSIPPLTSTKGYTAATWTDDPRRHIFTARLRAIETAIPEPGGGGGDGDRVKMDIVLEDPSSGQLFAAAPYAEAAVVEPTLDSSRFFALRVRDPAGRKAVLGIGFEERSDSFDFGVALQEARRAIGLDRQDQDPGRRKLASPSSSLSADKEVKRDYSLREGETITINLGGTKFGARRSSPEGRASASLSSFALPPPPPSRSSQVAASGSFSLPPPPPPSAGARSLERSIGTVGTVAEQQAKQTAADFGFDDGQFGEFA